MQFKHVWGAMSTIGTLRLTASLGQIIMKVTLVFDALLSRKHGAREGQGFLMLRPWVRFTKFVRTKHGLMEEPS